MRLINVHTHELEEFYPPFVPPYAILSHTWGRQEVSLNEWQRIQQYPNDNDKNREGYAKVVGTCLRAAEAGLNYIWADTACIDKASSAELSEAINSMFAWYEAAAACYVYLADVAGPKEEEIRGSRWFRRGWTLQELIAPTEVVFFSREWTELGSKDGLCATISEITGIRRDVLTQSGRFREATVAERISWMSDRATTRPEDMAYCMLGLFEINMALMYGEGNRAFLRLQQEIIRVSDDQSVFCWTYCSPQTTDWTGFLAPHPSAFRHSAKYALANKSSPIIPFTITNAGLSIQVPVLYTCTGILAILDVAPDAAHPDMRVGIPLDTTEERERYGRVPLHKFPVVIHALAMERTQIYINCMSPSRASGRPLLMRQNSQFSSTTDATLQNDENEASLGASDSIFLVFNDPVRVETIPLSISGSPDMFSHARGTLRVQKAPGASHRSGAILRLHSSNPEIQDFLLLVAAITSHDRTMWYVEGVRLGYRRGIFITDGRVLDRTLEKIEHEAVDWVGMPAKFQAGPAYTALGLPLSDEPGVFTRPAYVVLGHRKLFTKIDTCMRKDGSFWGNYPHLSYLSALLLEDVLSASGPRRIGAPNTKMLGQLGQVDRTMWRV